MRNLIIAAVIAISANTFLIGCVDGDVSHKNESNTQDVNGYTFPLDFKNIKLIHTSNYGWNKWYTFEYNGKVILFHYADRRACMTVIGDVE